MPYLSLIQRVFIILVIASFMNLVVFDNVRPLYAQEEEQEGSTIKQPELSDTSKIILKKVGIFKQQYFFGDEPLKSEKDFETVLSVHPKALKEYKRGRPYAYIGLVGIIGMTILVVKQFANTMKQANDPMNESGSGWGDVTLIAISGGVTVVSNIISSNYLKKSVNIFNKKQERNEKLMNISDSDISQDIEIGLHITSANDGNTVDYSLDKGGKAVVLVTYKF